MTKRVLIIEDDEQLGAQIVNHLQKAGFGTTWINAGRELLPDELHGVELVVLDLMLPGLHGFDVLKQLRAFSEVPVLVLSARSDTVDKVRGLRLGADDYLTKPFWPEELVERVRARLRRPLLERAGGIQLGALRIEKERRLVLVDNAPVALTRLEFELLLALAERAGSAVTRHALAERVLDPDRDGDERTLDVHVSRLRKKLGGSFIQTVWGIGYRLASGRDE